MQNPNGGFGTWELQRTYPWVEVIFVLTLTFSYFILLVSMHE
jgi:hypothetical protein